ncbi:hypothetical protein [Magnetofaba australis]|uniref:hypothetical protein n=1 Tax=Magnetofaba australis TaxID=1472297 RepID=UPI00117EBAB4|nr:hypothetical protein [Magnetofaba australis]
MMKKHPANYPLHNKPENWIVYTGYALQFGMITWLVYFYPTSEPWVGWLEKIRVLTKSVWDLPGWEQYSLYGHIVYQVKFLMLCITLGITFVHFIVLIFHEEWRDVYHINKGEWWWDKWMPYLLLIIPLYFGFSDASQEHGGALSNIGAYSTDHMFYAQHLGSHFLFQLSLIPLSVTTFFGWREPTE